MRNRGIRIIFLTVLTLFFVDSCAPNFVEYPAAMAGLSKGEKILLISEYQDKIGVPPGGQTDKPVTKDVDWGIRSQSLNLVRSILSKKYQVTIADFGSDFPGRALATQSLDAVVNAVRAKVTPGTYDIVLVLTTYDDEQNAPFTFWYSTQTGYYEVAGSVFMAALNGTTFEVVGTSGASMDVRHWKNIARSPFGMFGFDPQVEKHFESHIAEIHEATDEMLHAQLLSALDRLGIMGD